MVESNPTLYLGEEMLGLHQEALETFFRDGRVDEGAGATAAAAGGGGGPDSPRARAGSEGGAAAGEARLRAASSQVCFVLFCFVLFAWLPCCEIRVALALVVVILVVVVVVIVVSPHSPADPHPNASPPSFQERSSTANT